MRNLYNYTFPGIKLVIYSFFVLAFSNCWLHPADIFDNNFVSHSAEFSPDEDIPFSKIQKLSEKFLPRDNETSIYLNPGRKPMWLSLNLKDAKKINGSNKKDMYIEIQSTYINNIEFYFPVRNAKQEIEYVSKRTGCDVFISQRDVSFRNPIVSIPDNTDAEKPLYIKFQSNLGQTFKLMYYSEVILYKRLRLDNYYFGIIFGILFAMLFNNIIVFAVLKTKTYLYYTLYIISILVFISNIYGQLWYILDDSLKYSGKILWISGGFVMVFSCQFVRNFLTTRKFSRRLDNVISMISLLGVSLTIFGILEFYTVTNYIARSFSVLAPLLYVSAGVLAIRNGLKSARLLFISWTVLSISFIGLATKGVHTPFTDLFTFVSLPAAFAIESILLSIALGNTLRTLQDEKEEAIRHGKRFEEMSITDPLTGFFNRRYFESKLQAEILHAKLMNRPLGVILLDFDNFKSINDTWGHAQGDIVLREVAKILTENKRREDILCRYGGEEFACLLPGSDIEGSQKIAEKMRQKCEAHLFSPKAFVHFNVTVSAGVSVLKSEDTMDSLIDRADKLMYEAKKTGKNRIISES